jgi:Domain of unknown function (DUF222)/HNH endonuclease
MCDHDGSAGLLSSTGDALAALSEALSFLASENAAGLSVAEQADCLLGLERAESQRIAIRADVLAAFTSARGFEGDGQGGARSWLRWQARITRAAASGAVSWMRRLSAHPAVRDALATGEMSESWARQICDWSDLLPEDARANADRILLTAAAEGADLVDLAALADEIRARTAEPDKDPGDGDGSGDNDGAGEGDGAGDATGDGAGDAAGDGAGSGGASGEGAADSDGIDDDSGDGSVQLDLHFRGAGRLTGDLSPRCAAALAAVLDALGKKTGPQDTRCLQQRNHDALEEACRRLIASGFLPDRAGQPTQIQLIMTLDQLLGRRGSRGLPAAPGPVARPGDLCDASIVPIVTGNVDHELLAGLASQLLAGQFPAGQFPTGPALAAPAQSSSGPTPRAERMAGDFARELILRNAVALLSGPAGLASRIRTATLVGPAASISLPLDVGTASDTIPPHIRRAVILRDQHCGFPGCEVQPAGCHVHHIIPAADGGPTRLDNLVLGCAFHHLIAIHKWGWKLVLNADGTKTALSPDRSRILRSHDPPAVAA